MEPLHQPADGTPTLSNASLPSIELRLIRHVNEKLQSTPATEVELISLEPGEVFSARATPVNPSFADASCILLSGNLIASAPGERHTFPAGYTIAHPSLLAAKWELRAGESETKILKISRDQLREWFHTDDSFYTLALARIHEVFPKERMPAISREQIRSARDESLLALTTRQAIDFVNRRGGLFEQLNPGGIQIFHHDTIGGRDRTIGVTEQIWQLVEAVSPVLIHVDEKQIEQYAEYALHTGNRLRTSSQSARVEMAMKWFQIEIAAVKSQIFEKNMPLLSASLREEGIVEATEAYQTIVDRVLQVHSLHEDALAARTKLPPSETVNFIYLNGDWDQSLRDCFESGKHSEHGGMGPLLDKLDETLEIVFQEARSVVDESLAHVRVEKFQLALDIDPVITEELPSDHPIRADMATLAAALASGDRSAVGGSAYPRQRFPRVTLNQLARDSTPVAIFDGNYTTGLMDVRQVYGRHPVDPSLLQRGTVVRLEGVYGSFEKSWCFFRDGSSAFIVSHTGEDRQLSNAAALQLFETRSGATISTSNMRLAREITPIDQRIKAAVESMLQRENDARRGATILGELILHPENIPTQTHSLQQPELLLELIRQRGGAKNNLLVIPVEDPILQHQFIAYWRMENGELTRLLLPTVGSRGLYGDTAGAYTKAVLLSKQLHAVSPHTFFSATCGGYAGTDILRSFTDKKLLGLPESIQHGDLIMPWSQIGGTREEIGFQNIMRYADSVGGSALETLKARIYRHFETLPLHHTSKHYCIGAPALETAGSIEMMIQSGFASVDVESMRILTSLQEVEAETGKRTTFTPIYVFSDDPRKGLSDLSQSLAFGAPLAEGSRAHPALYEALIDMMALATYLERAQ